MLHRDITTTPMNVLVATPGGTAGQGGIDRIMGALRDELGRQALPGLTATFAASRGNGHLIASPFHLSAFLARMVAMKASGTLDLVHINLASEGSTHRKLVIAATARMLKVPYVVHLHGGDYKEYWKGDDSRLSRAIRTMFVNAARIVVLGDVWRRFVAGRVPEVADRIRVIPNAAPQPKLKHVGGGDTAHILFLGRLYDLKGTPQLGEALRLMKDVPGWRATLAGDGGVAAARAKAREWGMEQLVDIPGWVDSQRVGELIASADILVLPSLVENLPLSIIEGMASGLAVVATPVGAVEDIVIDGETGLLVPPGNVPDLAAALTRLVNDRPLRERMGAAGLLVHRERLDLGPYALAMADLWRQAVALRMS